MIRSPMTLKIPNIQRRKKNKGKHSRVESEHFDAPSDAPSTNFPNCPVPSSPGMHQDVSMKNLEKFFVEVDANECLLQQGKYVQALSSLKMPKDILSIDYHLGKHVSIKLNHVCFWRIFHNLEWMFRNNPWPEVALTHIFDVGADWKEVHENRRQLRDSHPLHFGEALVPREPS